MVPNAETRDSFGLVGQVLDQRFRVDEVIAEGGFGVVYRAHQLRLDRTVALKALKIDESGRPLSDFRERFADEARTMARLKHPHIADVYDSGISELPAPGGGMRQIPWIALEWLEGSTLEQWLEKRRGSGGQSPAEALAFLRSALEGVAHAHRQGVAHRDIKPGNMMLTRTPVGSTLRILDFGISKLMQPDETPGTGRTRTAGGYAFSPGYAAPDQISGGRTGPWTDVHALGLVLTEVLTDEPPVSGPDIAIFSQLLGESRPTPGSKGKQVGPWEAIIARALALQPSDRWRDAGALLAALEATVTEAERAFRQAREGRQNAGPAAPTVRAPATASSQAALAPDPVGREREVIPDRRARAQEVVPEARAAGTTTEQVPRGARRWLLPALAAVALAVAAAVGLNLRQRQTDRPQTAPIASPTPAPVPAAAAQPSPRPAPSEAAPRAPLDKAASRPAPRRTTGSRRTPKDPAGSRIRSGDPTQIDIH
jgi:hypothetical protein